MKKFFKYLGYAALGLLALVILAAIFGDGSTAIKKEFGLDDAQFTSLKTALTDTTDIKAFLEDTPDAATLTSDTLAERAREWVAARAAAEAAKEEKKKAEQAAREAAEAAEEAAEENRKACIKDWKKCKDNEELVNNYTGMTAIKRECKKAVEQQAKYDGTEFPWVPFGQFYTGTAYIESGEVILIENNLTMMNGFGAKMKMQAQCFADLATGTVKSAVVGRR